MKYKFYFLLFLLAIVVTSCKTVSKNADNSGNVSSEAALFESIKDNRNSFHYFNTAAKLNIESEFFEGSASAKIRLAKDSILWMSVSKLGFEIGRVLITPDSIIGLERIQKTYFKLDNEEIISLVGYDLNFQMLQDFILGNPYLDDENNLVKFSSPDTLQVIPFRDDAKVTHYFHVQSLELLASSIFMDPQIQIDMSFSEYAEIPNSGKNFSYFRSIDVEAENEYPLSVSFDFNKPEIDIEKSYKLSIPDSYSPREF